MEKLFRQYLKWVIGHPWIVVLVVALLTGAAVSWLVVFRPLKLDKLLCREAVVGRGDGKRMGQKRKA